MATTIVLLPRYGIEVLRTEHPRYQLLRGTLLLVSSTLAFLSLRDLRDQPGTDLVQDQRRVGSVHFPRETAYDLALGGRSQGSA